VESSASTKNSSSGLRGNRQKALVYYTPYPGGGGRVSFFRGVCARLTNRSCCWRPGGGGSGASLSIRDFLTKGGSQRAVKLTSTKDVLTFGVCLHGGKKERAGRSRYTKGKRKTECNN